MSESRESAFPIVYAEPTGTHVRLGMSLRDWFAGQALAGILANPKARIQTDERAETLVKNAYALADLMLKAREG